MQTQTRQQPQRLEISLREKAQIFKEQLMIGVNELLDFQPIDTTWEKVQQVLHFPITGSGHTYNDSLMDSFGNALDMTNHYANKRLAKRAMTSNAAQYKGEYRIGYFDNTQQNSRLALVISTTSEIYSKYIVGTNKEGKTVIASQLGDLHRNIVFDMTQSGEDLTGISGGYIQLNNGKSLKDGVTLYGASQDYGKADHQRVAEILQSHGIEAKVMEEKK